MTDRAGSNAPPALHDLERQIMDEIWDRGSATTRDVLAAINARHHRQRAYTTVMTVMQILARKQLLTRRRVGKTDVYAAVLGREAYIDARADAEVGAIIAEYGDVALAHFARRMRQVDSAP